MIWLGFISKKRKEEKKKVLKSFITMRQFLDPFIIVMLKLELYDALMTFPEKLFHIIIMLFNFDFYFQLKESESLLMEKINKLTEL